MLQVKNAVLLPKANWYSHFFACGCDVRRTGRLGEKINK